MPFIWVALAIPVLIFLQRWIHMHLHGIALMLTGKSEGAVILYALVLLPGVFLHELSHWLSATLLGVRTGTFSIIPKMQDDGTVQLGYVEYYKGRNLGPIRESIIGGAPLLVGTAVIILIGYRVFSVTNLAAAIQSGHIDTLSTALGEFFQTNDVLLWLYLLFAISNGMLPSKSDRRAWPAFLLIMSGLGIVLYVLGLGTAVIDGLTQPATVVFGYLGLAFSIAIGVDLMFMLLIAATENIISRIKGVSVVYSSTDAPSGSEMT
ncbi:MAG: hypothetical protein DWQ04_19820 [Chloroflexi bacterium]|nr:MAG: hypothetical protein DWQ04_19820 [Chloroflexota bacterium]